MTTLPEASPANPTLRLGGETAGTFVMVYGAGNIAVGSLVAVCHCLPDGLLPDSDGGRTGWCQRCGEYIAHFRLADPAPAPVFDQVHALTEKLRGEAGHLHNTGRPSAAENLRWIANQVDELAVFGF